MNFQILGYVRSCIKILFSLAFEDADNHVLHCLHVLTFIIFCCRQPYGVKLILMLKKTNRQTSKMAWRMSVETLAQS